MTVTANTTISVEFEVVNDDSSVDSSSSNSEIEDIIPISCSSTIETGSTLLMISMIAVASLIIKKKKEN